MGAICGKRNKEPDLPEDPTPDPVTGLTQRQKILLRRSWYSLLHRGPIKETGGKLLIKVFTKHPELLSCYDDLKNCEISQLADNANFRAYAVSTVMRTSAYIESLDDPDILVALIFKHSFTQNATRYTLEDMEKIKEVILEFLEEESGLDAKSEVIRAWDQLFTFHNQCYEKKLATMNTRNTLSDCTKQIS